MVVAYADGCPDRFLQLLSDIVQFLLIVLIVRIYIGLAFYLAVRFKLPETVLAVAPAQIAVLRPCRADEIVELFLQPSELRLIIGILRGFFPSHLEPIAVKIRSRVIQEIHPVRAVVHHDVPPPFRGGKGEQTARFLRFIIHRHKAYHYFRICIPADFIQLVIHHIHILPAKLHIGLKGCLRGACPVYLSAVHIPFDGHVQTPGRLVGRFMVHIVAASGLDGVGFRCAHAVLSVDYLIGHVRMVYVQQLPVCVRGQLVLQVRYLSRIQSQLLAAASPYLVHHGGIAWGCRPLIYRFQNQVRIRHGETGFPGINLISHPFNGTDDKSPVREAAVFIVDCFRLDFHQIALVSLLIAAFPYRFIPRAYHLAVQGLDDVRRKLQVSARIRGDDAAVLPAAFRRDRALALRAGYHRILLVIVKTAKAYASRISRHALPSACAGLRRRYNTAAVIKHGIVRLGVRRPDDQPRFTLVFLVVENLVVGIHYRRQYLHAAA